MIPYKLNSRLVLLAVIGIALYFMANIWSSLYSTDSLDPPYEQPKVSKAQATHAATEFISKQFPEFAAGPSTIVYDSNKSLSSYVQKYNFSKVYQELYGVQYPLNYWRVNLKDARSNASYVVQIGMVNPDIVAWRKTTTTRARNSMDQQAIAEQYLARAGYNLKQLQITTPKSGDSPNLIRIDSLDKAIGKAHLQLTLRVAEDSIISFEPEFAVPTSDIRWIERQDKYADRMSLISALLTLLLGLVALGLVIRNRKFISFRRGVFLSLLFWGISSVNSINMMELIDTDVGLAENHVFNAANLILSFGFNFIVAAAIYFMLLSGDQLWREEGWQAWPQWRQPRYGEHVFHAMGRGYLICLFIIGVQQILFLFAGNIFQSFAINDPSQSEFNMLWPGIFPTMAWMAGISEEIIFRLFGIIFFKRLTGNNFIAILLSSVIWALGHTSYSIYPSYTRLFEVAVLGIIFGYVFLKYGLITAIFAHVAMDSLLMGLSLIFSFGTSQYAALGLFYILLPAIVGYLILRLHRKFWRHPSIQPLMSPVIQPGEPPREGRLE